MPAKLLFALCLLLILSQSAIQAHTSDEKRVSFTIKAAPWNLTLPQDNLVVETVKYKPDGEAGYFMMRDEKREMNISFFIEPALKCKDSKSCRDMVWKLGNPSWVNPQNIVQAEIEGASYFEFLIPVYQDMPVKQQNMYIQFVEEGFWVDLHLSKALYKPEEHKLFEQIVKSVKFEPKKAQTGE